MSDVERSLTFNDLMAKLGWFLYFWSSFELQLSKRIVAIRAELEHEPAPIPTGLKQRLDLWIDLDAQLRKYAADAYLLKDIREQALALREIRNLIVHGLAGGHAQPEDNLPAYISCVIGGLEAPTKRVKTYDMADLERFIQGTDACLRGLINPQSFDYRIQPNDHEGLG